ncbi:MAG: hypothetical protein IJG33_17270 [Selenomonadaceae bacterium]|nr:hypothetical protein [Selenomonadaceae bacterium]
MTFFEGWFALNSCFDKCDIPASTQLVGYKLFAIFNERKFPESLTISDRELMSRTNIKSGRTIVEARRQLKNAGLIDFKAAKARATCYKLASKQEVSKIEASGKQEVSKNEASSVISHTPKAEDERPKTSDDAREGADANDIQDEWTRAIGFELRGNRALELERLAGIDWRRTVTAIRRTAKQNGLSDEYAYFKAVYDGLAKGGERHDGWLNYAEPDTAWVDE